MNRKEIRSFKRTIYKSMRAEPGSLQNESKDCALALLERSIAFGHGRLALIRLCTAVELQATIPAEHWHYCAQVASKSADAKLRNLYLQAKQRIQF